MRVMRKEITDLKIVAAAVLRVSLDLVHSSGPLWA